MENSGGWDEYAKLVLSELQRLNTSIETLRTDLNERDKTWHENLQDIRSELHSKILDAKSEYQDINKDLSVKVGQLQAKATIMGFMAGAIPGLVALALKLLN